MEQKPGKGLFKHRDFIIIDLICMPVSFAIAYWLNGGSGSPFGPTAFRMLAVLLFFSQLVVIVFSDNYNGILRRGYLKELSKVLGLSVSVLLVSALALFVLHIGTVVSRLQLGMTLVIYVIVSYIARLMRKSQLLRSHKRNKEEYSRSIVAVTSKALIDEIISNLKNDTVYNDRYLSGICLMDGGSDSVKDKYDIPIIDLDAAAIERIRSRWVDEVLIYQPRTGMGQNGRNFGRMLLKD